MPTERLERALAIVFPREEERERARAMLASYGAASHESEHERVWFAMLALCDGSLDELAALISLGKLDYRDVLTNAEYSEEGKKSWELLRARVLDDDE